MIYNVLDVITFLICLASFIYGLITNKKYNQALYFRHYTYAAGCYALVFLWYIVGELCKYESNFFSVQLFGAFGFYCFMLSANIGGFDSLIDENTKNSAKAKYLGLIAPAVQIIIGVICHLAYYKDVSVFSIVIYYILIIPAAFASYFNLKHLFLPADELGLLKSIRRIDIISLLLYLLNALVIVQPTMENKYLYAIETVGISLLIFALINACERSGKIWKTLI